MLFSMDTNSTLCVELKTLVTSEPSVLPDYEQSCIGFHSYTFRSFQSSCRPASYSCCGLLRQCQGLESSLEGARSLFLTHSLHVQTRKCRQVHTFDWLANGCTSWLCTFEERTEPYAGHLAPFWPLVHWFLHGSSVDYYAKIAKIDVANQVFMGYLEPYDALESC